MILDSQRNTTNPYKSPQVYWCQVCDSNQVDSTKPETGKFYHCFGHDFETGDYTSVFFAHCARCLNDPATLHRDEISPERMAKNNE